MKLVEEVLLLLGEVAASTSDPSMLRRLAGTTVVTITAHSGMSADMVETAAQCRTIATLQTRIQWTGYVLCASLVFTGSDNLLLDPCKTLIRRRDRGVVAGLGWIC